MSHWTTDLSGLHEAIDFLEQWWPFFLGAPIIVTPILVALASRNAPKKQTAKAPEADKKRRSPSKKRRSLTRRMFVDDSIGQHRRQSFMQLYAGTYLAATLVSILLFLGIVTAMIVRALVLVNTAEMQ